MIYGGPVSSLPLGTLLVSAILLGYGRERKTIFLLQYVVVRIDAIGRSDLNPTPATFGALQFVLRYIKSLLFLYIERYYLTADH